MMARKLLLVLGLAVCTASPVAAQDMASFRSPSGNIGCMYLDGFLRCDVAEVSNRQPRPPADCEFGWGQAFEMERGSRRAARICHGDTVLDPGAPVLRYGASWEGGGFSCLSSERGISCRNARGAGWDLSRRAQTVH